MSAAPSPRVPLARRAAWETVGVVLIALLLLDALLAWLPAAPVANRALSDERVDGILHEAATAEQPFLLVGDSVLAGGVLARETADPEALRVVDAMRRGLGDGDPATFHQVAIDGVLLPDVLAILDRLDRVDPNGSVALVVGLNVRQFSPAYADVDEPAHGWLDTWSSWGGLRALTPVLRHRSRFPLGDGSWVDNLATAPVQTIDEVEARARLAAHYRAPALGPHAAPLRALAEILQQLRDRDRTALFFLTPLEDGFVNATLGDNGMARISGALSHAIDGGGRHAQRFISLDHPLFGPDAFIDHCHLSTRGTDRLARNLLELLDRRVRDPLESSDRAYEEGDDATLLTNLLPGARDGPPWLARLQGPTGLAVRDDGRRVVIADTGNHLLRELVGDLRTLRTLAGVPGETGTSGGPARETPLSHPHSPVLLGDTVYFLAGEAGDTLWQVKGGRVDVAADHKGRPIGRLRSLKRVGEQLLALDSSGELWAVTPGKRKRKRVQVTDGELEAFAFSRAGDLFVADRRGRIFAAAPDALTSQVTLNLGGVDGELAPFRLVFSNRGPPDVLNDGRAYLPNVRNAFFPFRADDVRFARVRDLIVAERYDALLIVGEERAARDDGVDELVHLRLFDLEQGLLYPWVRPRLSGGAYIAPNNEIGRLTSPVRQGALALHQPTAALFSLERQRGRLTVINDGLWGLTRVGHTPSGRKFGTGRHELLASRAGANAHARFLPEQHLGQRFTRQTRRGPFVVLFVTSSLSTLSDRVGMLPLGRQLERRWRRHQAARDQLRLHVIQRAFGGPTLDELIGAVEQHLDAGGRPDVILLEMGDALGRLFAEPQTAAGRAAALDRLLQRAEAAGAAVIGLDVTPLDNRHQEGPRAPRETVAQLGDLLIERGVVVVDDNTGLLRESLEVAPFGSVPWRSSHASPWAMAAAGERLADRLYPHIRRVVAERPPRWQAPAPEAPRPTRLRDTLPPVVRSSLDERAVWWTSAGGSLEVFVDLNHVEAGTAAGPALAKDALRYVATTDLAALLAERVRLRLARFSAYDEYGAGAAEGATILWERTLDAEAAGAWLRESIDAGTPSVER